MGIRIKDSKRILRPQLVTETAREKILHPHPYQIVLALARQKEIIASTGQGTGKSSWAPWLIMLTMASYSTPGEYIFVEPTYGMVEKVAIPRWEKAVEGTYFEGHWKSKKDKIYENRFGLLYFLSAEKPKHIQGIHARLAIIDEGGQISREAYMMIKGRTNMENGRVIVLTNPYHGNDPFLYTEVLERYYAGDPNVLFLFFGSEVNPAFDMERYEEDKKTMTKEEFEFQYGGRYTKPAGLIYDYEDRDVIKETKYNGEVTYAGVDFGISDPTVVEIAIVNTTGVHIIHEYDVTNVEFSGHAAAFAKLQEKYRIKLWFPDYEGGTGISAIREIDKEIKRLGKPPIRWKHAEKDVVKGIQAVKKLYREKRLTISPACRRLLKENAGWIWTKDGKPIDKNDHAETAVRLLVTGINKYVNIKRAAPSERKPKNIFEREWEKLMAEINGTSKKKKEVDWLNRP